MNQATEFVAIVSRSAREDRNEEVVQLGGVEVRRVKVDGGVTDGGNVTPRRPKPSWSGAAT